MTAGGKKTACPFFFSFLGEGATAFGYELELFRGTPEYFAGLEQVYWV